VQKAKRAAVPVKEESEEADGEDGLMWEGTFPPARPFGAFSSADGLLIAECARGRLWRYLYI
jgi:hypothetical protein